MRKLFVLLSIAALAASLMVMHVATAACRPGSVGDQIFSQTGGDPSGGQLEGLLATLDAAADPVTSATGQHLC